jgi:hypothetical protein
MTMQSTSDQIIRQDTISHEPVLLSVTKYNGKRPQRK